MNSAQLKLFVFAVWIGIVLVAAFLILWAIANRDSIFAPLPTPANLIIPTLEAPPTLTPIPPTIIPTITPTRRPTFTPVPTNTLFVLPMAQYNATLAPGVNPLTGLRLDDPSILDRRPVAVKIMHSPRYIRAWQKGLSLADVAYEYYIEDGLTRYIAVYYGQDAAQAGPVRSARYFDEHVIRMYQASFVFGEADERVKRFLLDSDLLPYLIVERSNNCPPLCRDPHIKDFSGLFVDTAAVAGDLALKQSDNSRPVLRPAFVYGMLSSWSMPQISRIFLHYSNYSYGYWEYDPAQGYIHFMDANDLTNGQSEDYLPHIDMLTGRQISAANVIVLFAPHTFNTIYDYADQVYNIKLIGQGKAILFRQGRMQEVSWIRDRIDQPIQLIDANGMPVPVSAGATFYQVLSDISGYEVIDSAAHFRMAIPPKPIFPSATPTATKSKKP
jgi:hypothetical protein